MSAPGTDPGAEGRPQDAPADPPQAPTGRRMLRQTAAGPDRTQDAPADCGAFRPPHSPAELQVIWDHHPEDRISQSGDDKEQKQTAHDDGQEGGQPGPLQPVGKFLQQEDRFFLPQRYQIHKGGEHGEQIPSLRLKIPGIGIDHAQNNGDRAGKNHYRVGKEAASPVLPGQVQILSDRKDGSCQTAAKTK